MSVQSRHSFDIDLALIEPKKNHSIKKNKA